VSAALVNNPGFLKLSLWLDGVAFDGGDLESDTLELLLDGELWARARISAGSRFRLVKRKYASFITDGATERSARIVPAPEFVARHTAGGIPLGEIIRMRGIYAMVALRGGCGLSATGRPCSVCLGRELTEKAGEMWKIQDVLDALGGAFDEGAAEAVHLQLGYFPGDDAGLQQVLPYVEAIRHHFDTMVALTMHPPASPRMIDLAYARGVDALSFNLEVADEASMQRHFPGRARFFGRSRYLDALRHAVKVFPSGAVWSELALGVSPPDAIRAAIDDLCGMGVVPLLGLPQAPVDRPSTAAELAPLCAKLFESALKAGVNMTWARDMPDAITPLEGRYFVPDAPQLPVLLHQLARNRLGAMAARSLSRLRRRLRVKRVRASLDSSRL
jgi:hypothetical protein